LVLNHSVGLVLAVNLVHFEVFRLGGYFYNTFGEFDPNGFFFLRVGGNYYHLEEDPSNLFHHWVCLELRGEESHEFLIHRFQVGDSAENSRNLLLSQNFLGLDWG